MPPPIVDRPLRLISFFKFAPLDADVRASLLPALRELLDSLRVRGTVYVAAEGVNGQLSVPVDAIGALQEGIARLPQLGDLVLNQQHARLGTVKPGTHTPPYRRLIVREKGQILTDGLGEAGNELDWQRAGTELEPAEWHAMLLSRERASGAVDGAYGGEGGAADPATGEGADAPLLLDCRNLYESDEGSFVGAEPLGTDTFAESWSVLRDRLADVPRDAPIMTFCTGGIRCVKTNAFLEQELGFTRTYRLKDGIHGYLRHAVDSADVESRWQGSNFVFYEKNEDDQVQNGGED